MDRLMPFCNNCTAPCFSAAMKGALRGWSRCRDGSFGSCMLSPSSRELQPLAYPSPAGCLASFESCSSSRCAPAHNRTIAPFTGHSFRLRPTRVVAQHSAEQQGSDEAASPSELSTSTSTSSSAAKPGKPPLVLPTPIPPTSNLNVEAFANGALLIDKPLEWTSFDVCAKVRNTLFRALGRLKVGHAGTLDPMATGLLILCTGKGTKSIDTFVAMTKQYSGTIRLGEGTVTCDAEAEVTERLPWDHITDADVSSAVSSSFNGDILQVPPMYSALKIKGQKLYHLARDGLVVERVARPIHISQFLIQRDSVDPQNLHFTVECSKGTYVRSLALDLGRALGSVAHLTALRRESIGDLHVRDAWPLFKLLDRVKEMDLKAEP